MAFLSELDHMLSGLISQTAVAMSVPSSYSLFHILICVIFVPLSLLAGAVSAEKIDDRVKCLRICGLVLLVSEIYKQLFLYYVEFDHSLNLWYLPLQLCSLPMYLSIFYPRNHPILQSRFTIFMADFGMLGAVMTLVYPEGIMHPYLNMTLHGFFWHFMLIFISVYCIKSAPAEDFAPAAFLRTLPVFLLSALCAFCIDFMAGPDASLDMFYISPWHVSAQPVFHEIGTFFGIGTGIAVYLFSVMAGALAVHLLAHFYRLHT